jgi:hypothetical protein
MGEGGEGTLAQYFSIQSAQYLLLGKSKFENLINEDYKHF